MFNVSLDKNYISCGAMNHEHGMEHAQSGQDYAIL